MEDVQLPDQQELPECSRKRKMSSGPGLESTGDFKKLNASLNQQQSASHLSSFRVPDLQEPPSFLKLPPELRNQIYDSYFQDPYEEVELELFETCKAPHFFPCADITSASKQIRKETYELFWAASWRFWRGHNFYVEFYARMRYEEVIRLSVRISDQLLELPALRNLMFKVMWHRQGPRSTLLVTASNRHKPLYDHIPSASAVSDDSHTIFVHNRNEMCTAELQKLLRNREDDLFEGVSTPYADDNINLDFARCMKDIGRYCDLGGFVAVDENWDSQGFFDKNAITKDPRRPVFTRRLEEEKRIDDEQEVLRRQKLALEQEDAHEREVAGKEVILYHE